MNEFQINSDYTEREMTKPERDDGETERERVIKYFQQLPIQARIPHECPIKDKQKLC